MPESDLQLLRPERWDGYDVFDGRLFIDAPPPFAVELGKRHRQSLVADLKHALGQVVAGNYTEVRFSAGNEFNPDLPDGTLLAVDLERLSRFGGLTPLSQPHHFIYRSSLPLSRPYVSYWLNAQGGVWRGSNVVGLTASDARVIYCRHLYWGVLGTVQKVRFIQLFSFTIANLNPDNTISVVAGQSPQLPVPVMLGEVQPQQRDGDAEDFTDTLGRVTAIDIVYPASGGRDTAPGRKNSPAAGRLALRPATGSA